MTEIFIDNFPVMFNPPPEAPTPKVEDWQNTIREIEAVHNKRQHRWDVRYVMLARFISLWSKDPSTQTGAVIVSPDNRIVSIGFNGFPRGFNDSEELYANRDVKLSRIVHAEMNALLFAKNLPPGSTLYNWPYPPCDRCFVHQIQSNIIRFVHPATSELSEDQQKRWGPAFERVKGMADEVGAELVEISRKELGVE